MRRTAAALVLAAGLLSPAPCPAEEVTVAEVLWSRALAELAAEDEGAGETLGRACDAGSAPACYLAASRAVEAGDLELAEDQLRGARDAAPDDTEVALALARVMALRGNHMWAVRMLQELEELGLEVDFELGYSLHELEMHERAAGHLARAAGPEGDGPMAALYGAASLERLDRQDEALALARLAAAAEGDPAVCDAGQGFVRALGRRGAAADRVLVSAFATASAGYDSNPVLGPDDAPSHAGGPRLWLRAAVFGEPLGGASWALGARLAASRDQSFDAAARPFDFTAVQAGVHGRFRLGSRPGHELRVAYQYSIGLLDGGPGVEEDELYAYNEAHLGSLAYGLELSDRTVLRFRARSGFAVFHNRARSGVPLDLALGPSLALLEGRLKLYLEGGLRAAWTRSPKYDRAGPTATVALAYLTPLWDLELVASWAFVWSLYPSSSGVQAAFDYARPELRRRDSLHVLGLELGRSFLDGHLRLAARYRMTDSSSSIDAYDYARHVAELAVTGGY